MKLDRSTLPVLRRLPAVALLFCFFTAALLSSQRQGPTFDEQGFLTRGLAYLRGEQRTMRVGHPLGLNALNAALLAADDSVRLPLDHPSWQERSFHRPAELFLWEIGNDVEKILFLGRLPTIWLGLLLVAVAGRWARELSRRDGAGWLAMALLALDPNIIAHSQLATTDLGLAAGATLAGYTLWRFLRAPSWGRLALAGAALGLLQNTKFTAGLFVPLFALLIGVALPWWLRRNSAGGRWRLLVMLIAYPLVGLLTLWATYGFQIGPLPDPLPALPQLAGRTLPLAHHLEQLMDIGGRLQKSTPAFLLGSYSDDGWWYYFPVAFLLKTPLPTLLLIAWALLGGAWRLLTAGGHLSPLRLLDSAALLIPALGYFAIALTTEINLGYRHLLPVLPFLVVFSAARLFDRPGAAPEHKSDAAPLAAVTLAVALFFIALGIYPHPLAYFNLIAGGPEGGWRYLVDSNLDWGQDLPNLGRWMAEQGEEHVWLSYFGEARPEYYGISYTGLDSFPPRLMDPAARPFYPWNPAPGLYAISATTLQGVHFQNHDLYAWFRRQQPLDRVGFSIFIYEVALAGAPLELALGNLQLDEIDPGQYALLESNQATPHWFDSATAWLLPAAGGSAERWLALAGDAAAWQPLLDAHYRLVDEREGRRLLRQESTPALPPEPLATLRRGASQFDLVDVAGLQVAYAPGERPALQTRWRQGGEPTPVMIFVHVLDASGQIAAQWDGLGAAWQGWRAGDLLYQRHELELPAEAAPGRYAVWAGLYEPASGARWQAGADDRVFLGEFVVEGRE